MSAEQRKILEMLAEGQITADQAERLLRAVDEGEGAIAAARDTISKLGDAVSEAVTDAVGVIEDHIEGGELVEDAGEGFALAPSAQLNIKVRGSSVTVTQGPDGSLARVTSSNGLGVKVIRKEDSCTVRVGRQSGNVDICIPPVHEVAVKVAGGETRMQGITAGRTHVTAHGGNLYLSDCNTALDAKCMGGDATIGGRFTGLNLSVMGGSVNLDGLAANTGEHRVKVMGGSLDITASDEASLLVQASVFGGGVSANFPPEKENQGSGPQWGATYRIGNGDGVLAVKVFGGNVSLHAPSPEPAAAPVEQGGK